MQFRITPYMYIVVGVYRTPNLPAITFLAKLPVNYKNMDEFGISCKKKNSVFEKIMIILFCPFCFFPFFFPL